MPFTPSFSHTLGPLELEVMRIVWAHDGPITIRTADLGADKQVDGGRRGPVLCASRGSV